MTPEHPLWTEFISRLSRAPICHGTTAHARGVLAAIVGIDVEGSLRALAGLGGRCDCEIEHDVAPIRVPAARIESAVGVEGAA